ncbi:MAG TPA: hypothetical protein VHA52_09600, partial [Candidatus Babeliaceae bacterium]|nr:hypothetical protein [Candidatus Babeliaceae bacterium]
MNNIIYAIFLVGFFSTVLTKEDKYSKRYSPIEKISVNFLKSMNNYFKFHPYHLQNVKVTNSEQLSFFHMLYQRNNLQKVAPSIFPRI